MARAEFTFGLIHVVIEDEKSTNATDVTNLAYGCLKSLLPDAKKIVRQERKELAKERKSMAKNMLALKGKAECDSCDEECGDEENCPHKKESEIKNLYV